MQIFLARRPDLCGRKKGCWGQSPPSVILAVSKIGSELINLDFQILHLFFRLTFSLFFSSILTHCFLRLTSLLRPARMSCLLNKKRKIPKSVCFFQVFSSQNYNLSTPISIKLIIFGGDRYKVYVFV